MATKTKKRGDVLKPKVRKRKAVTASKAKTKHEDVTDPKTRAKKARAAKKKTAKQNGENTTRRGVQQY